MRISKPKFIGGKKYETAVSGDRTCLYFCRQQIKNHLRPRFKNRQSDLYF